MIYSVSLIHLFGVGGNRDYRCTCCSKERRKGVQSAPNITLYYQVALLDNLVQWWNSRIKYSWEIEQMSVNQSFSEWALSVIFSSSAASHNNNVKILSRMWKRLQGYLAPGQLPLASFLKYPKF